MQNKDNHEAIVSVMNSIPNCLCNLEGGCCGDDPASTKGSDRQKAHPPKNNNNKNLFKDLLKDIKEPISNKGSKDVS